VYIPDPSSLPCKPVNQVVLHINIITLPQETSITAIDHLVVEYLDIIATRAFYRFAGFGACFHPGNDGGIRYGTILNRK
jgi:hypothetical protein